MNFDIEGLEGMFSYMKLANIKEPAIETMNAILKNKKVQDENLFVIEGLWAYEKMNSSNVSIKAFAFCPAFIRNYSMFNMVKFYINQSEKSFLISEKLCDRLSSRDGKEGFFVLCSFPEYGFFDVELKKNNLIVVLDDVEKPGNIGTIIRSVDGAGGDGVVMCNCSVKKTNQKLIKSSMGSSFTLPVIKSNLTETIAWLKHNEFRVIVTDLRADKNFRNANYKGRVAIIAGNEIHGVSQQWKEAQCERVIIPMLGTADSLNVGVAASIIAYEASYQQRNSIEVR